MDLWFEFFKILLSDDSEQLLKEIEKNPNIVHLENSLGTDLINVSITDRPSACFWLLIAAGANIHKQNVVGNTSLSKAASFGNFKIAEYLLEKGVAVSIRNKENKSAFDFAMDKESKAIFKLGSDYNEPKDIRKWFELFAPYKDQFDEQDLNLYHAYRLEMLFR